MQPRVAKQFTIENVETLKVIADPLRLKILRTLRRPKAVKQIAAELDIPSTKLYYHVNQLEKHGLIQIVATNIVSGIIEKEYQIVARRYHVDEALLSDEEFSAKGSLENLVVTVIEDTKDEIIKSIRAKLLDLSNKNAKNGRFIRGGLRLTDAQAAEFGARLETLCQEFEELSIDEEEEPGGQAYGFTVAFYPRHLPEETQPVEIEELRPGADH